MSMNSSMITQDAKTFVALGRAVSQASLEGALDEKSSLDLTAALVAGILTGCMEFDTYAQVHDALAKMLELAFEGPARAAPIAALTENPLTEAKEESPFEVYLEIVGDAWKQVGWDEESSTSLKRFVLNSFDLSQAEFGNGCWFKAPLKENFQTLSREAKFCGLSVLSISGRPPTGKAQATMRPTDAPMREARMIVGWGDRQTAIDLHAAE